VKAGDLVVITVRRPCSHESCETCRAGRQDYCFTGDFKERGIKQEHGFMTEFVVEEERYLNVVPRELRDVGVLIEPLTIAEKSLEQLRTVQQRLPWSATHGDRKRRAVVLGAGPVGLLGAMALQVSGFAVTMYSRASQEKSDIIRAIGADYIASESQSVEDMAKAAGPIDVVYEALGASGLAFDVIKYLGPNGVFIFTGVPGRKGPVEVDTDFIMKDVVLNNQVILGTVNAPPHCFESAVDHLGQFMRQWPSAVRSLITARFPIDGALGPLSAGGGIKNVIAVAS
jgi:glucose 1-dehydrogenase